MPQIVFHLPDGSIRTATASADVSVMAAALAHGVPGIDGDCGGSMTCATCRVVIVEPDALMHSSEEEWEMLEAFNEGPEPGSRLSCQVTVTDDDAQIVVEIPA